MGNLRLWFVAAAIWLGGVPALFAAEALPPAKDVEAMTARVDDLIAARWALAGVRPAPVADDSEYLRRVYLDITGRIPSVAEVRDFLADGQANKRRLLVDRLLASPRFTHHLANTYRTMLLPEASSNIIARFMVPSVEAWVRKQIASGAGYDKLVRDLLSLPLSDDAQQVLQETFTGGGEPKPLGYFIAKDTKAENLAAAATRTFMGIRLECAQCHDHPHAPWTREQFWSQAAFFAGIKQKAQEEITLPQGEDLSRRDITIPKTQRKVRARFLDGTQPTFQDKVSPRVTLAKWLTAPANPYFARAATNRLWGQFFGTGIVDPVDDMLGNDAIKPSHPELLDELAQQFAVHQFDVKYLIRVITASKAYQLSSRRPPLAATASGRVTTPKGTQDDPALFARAALRGLTPDQLFDSIARATGHVEPPSGSGQVALLALYTSTPRNKLMTKFANQPEKATDVETSILQALALMNGKFIADATSLDKSTFLAAVADAPFMDTSDRIEALYLATLSRMPKAQERERLIKYIDSASDEKARNKNRALTDVFWALLNSGEFFLNH